MSRTDEIAAAKGRDDMSFDRHSPDCNCDHPECTRQELLQNEIDGLITERDELRVMLEEMKDDMRGVEICPFCFDYCMHHKPDCKLVLLLDRTKENGSHE